MEQPCELRPPLDILGMQGGPENGNLKIWCYQFGIYSRFRLALSRFLDAICSSLQASIPEPAVQPDSVVEPP